MTAVVLSFPAMEKRRVMPPAPNRVRELRKRAGLSLKSMAPMIGISFTQLGKIETGGRDLNQYWMEKIGAVLGVAAADLLNPQLGGLHPDERELIDTYRELPAAMRGQFDALREKAQPWRGAPEVVPLARPSEPVDEPSGQAAGTEHKRSA